jgi:Effector Associated Constant Component 1
VTTGTAYITVDGTDEELRSLATWLRDEDDLRGQVRLSSAPIQEGHMGGALEAVTVILTSGTVSVAIKSVMNWLTARKAAEKVTLKLNAGPGRDLELTCGSSSDAQAVLDSARKFFEENP